MDDLTALVRLVKIHRLLPRAGALLVANPPPAAIALPRAELDDALASAHRQAAEAGIVGDRLTPFLLQALQELTGGRTLRVNRGLALANAELAARLAVALADASAAAV